MSHVLQGGFLTTGPPGKPKSYGYRVLYVGDEDVLAVDSGAGYIIL